MLRGVIETACAQNASSRCITDSGKGGAWRILGYLRSSGVEHGLLINFGAPKFEIKKYALSRIGEVSRPGGLIGGTLSLPASLAPFCGWFHFGC